MKRVLLSAVSVLCACSGSPSVSDAGQDSGEPLDVVFDVAGTAAIYPEGLNLLNDAGMSTSVAGLTARVEEPLKVALSDPLGQFSSTVLDSSGSFTATQISSELVNLGVAAGIVDDAGTRAIRSATVLWDVALEGKKPDRNITGGKAWVIPKPLHELLNSAITTARIDTITGANQRHTLIEAGFILGRVVSATGAPVSGVTITPTTAALQSQFFYPTADYSGVGAATSSSGLFIYVHTGGDVRQFQFDVTGATGYKRRNAGAAKDACLVVTVYPGTTPP